MSCNSVGRVSSDKRKVGSSSLPRLITFFQFYSFFNFILFTILFFLLIFSLEITESHNWYCDRTANSNVVGSTPSQSRNNEILSLY